MRLQIASERLSISYSRVRRTVEIRTVLRPTRCELSLRAEHIDETDQIRDGASALRPTSGEIELIADILSGIVLNRVAANPHLGGRHTCLPSSRNIVTKG